MNGIPAEMVLPLIKEQRPSPGKAAGWAKRASSNCAVHDQLDQPIRNVKNKKGTQSRQLAETVRGHRRCPNPL
jgi:hypothetical protein